MLQEQPDVPAPIQVRAGTGRKQQVDLCCTAFSCCISKRTLQATGTLSSSLDVFQCLYTAHGSLQCHVAGRRAVQRRSALRHPLDSLHVEQQRACLSCHKKQNTQGLRATEHMLWMKLSHTPVHVGRKPWEHLAMGFAGAYAANWMLEMEDKMIAQIEEAYEKYKPQGQSQ
jgi:hypothetical protein